MCFGQYDSAETKPDADFLMLNRQSFDQNIRKLGLNLRSRTHLWWQLWFIALDDEITSPHAPDSSDVPTNFFAWEYILCQSLKLRSSLKLSGALNSVDRGPKLSLLDWRQQCRHTLVKWLIVVQWTFIELNMMIQVWYLAVLDSRKRDWNTNMFSITMLIYESWQKPLEFLSL